jgi:hypothetical protein
MAVLRTFKHVAALNWLLASSFLMLSPLETREYGYGSHVPAVRLAQTGASTMMKTGRNSAGELKGFPGFPMDDLRMISGC